MEAIQLEIGLELVPFVKTEDVEENNLISSIRQMRRDMERADHYLIPPIRICDNTSFRRAATAYSFTSAPWLEES